VHNGSGNLFVLHKGGNGTSLAVLFHREPERVCSFRLKCSANVAPGWHRPPPPAIDTESQHGHLHYVTVFEAQSSVVGAQGIEHQCSSLSLRAGTSSVGLGVAPPLDAVAKTRSASPSAPPGAAPSVPCLRRPHTRAYTARADGHLFCAGGRQPGP
jgi:hypothetical protein